MSAYEWLKDLKVGDPVILHIRGYQSNRSAVAKIERETKSLFFTHERKFRKDTGWESPRFQYGRGASLRQYTPELGAKIKADNEHATLISFFRTIDPTALSVTCLTQIKSLVVNA